MCLTIDQYRAAVGLFNARVCVRRSIRVSFMHKWLCTCLSAILKLISDGLFMKAGFLLFIFILILTCGDIETNPGPVVGDHTSIDSDGESVFDDISHFCKIVHLNVRSLLTCHEQISVEFQEYDIIALTETFLDNNITNDDIHIAGFDKVF